MELRGVGCMCSNNMCLNSPVMVTTAVIGALRGAKTLSFAPLGGCVSISVEICQVRKHSQDDMGVLLGR